MTNFHLPVKNIHHFKLYSVTDVGCLKLQVRNGRSTVNALQTFPGQSLSRTDVSQTDVSRTSYTKEFSGAQCV